jgi:hypothetical protein
LFFSCSAFGTVFFLFVFVPISMAPLVPSIFFRSHASTPRDAGPVGGYAKALTVTLKGIRPTRPTFSASSSEAKANRRTSGEMETKTQSKKENHMNPSKNNLKKAAAKVEAQHQSVQSAKWVADQIDGEPEYRNRVEALILKTCAIFGGQVVGVRQ